VRRRGKHKFLTVVVVFFLVFFLTAAPVMDVRRESPIAIVVAALDDRIHRCQ
jgi:hypothetical protein